jgi:hypothetical protein
LVNPGADLPTNDLSLEQIDHGGQVQPPLLGLNERDVTNPGDVGFTYRKLTV